MIICLHIFQMQLQFVQKFKNLITLINCSLSFYYPNLFGIFIKKPSKKKHQEIQLHETDRQPKKFQIAALNQLKHVKSAQNIRNMKLYSDKLIPSNSNKYISNQASTRNSVTINSDSNSSAYFIFDQVYDRKRLKSLLFKDYQNSIKTKNEQSISEKTKQIQLQKQFLRKNKQIDNMIMRNYENTKKKNQIKFKDQYQKKLQQKKQQKWEKEELNNRQRQSLESKKKVDKRAVFREYFKNHEEQREIIEKNYLKNVIPEIKKREEEKERIWQRKEGEGRFLRFYDKSQQGGEMQNIATKNEYKSALEKQIKEKQFMKRNYSDNKLFFYQNQARNLNYYNPITNPVNLGINPQNRYIVKQIRNSILYPNTNRTSQNIISLSSQKSQSNMRGMSILARSGSQILI